MPTFSDLIEVINFIYKNGGVVDLCMIVFWGIFITTYLLLSAYDRAQLLKLNGSRKTRLKNHFYVLPLWGVCVVILWILQLSGTLPLSVPLSNVMSVVVQFVGLLFMVYGLALVIRGRIHLNGFWGPDIYTYQPGKDKLVVSGPYKHCRHPIYCGQMAMALGSVLIANNWVALIPTVMLVVASILRAKREDEDLESRFGLIWEEYREPTYGYIWIPGKIS